MSVGCCSLKKVFFPFYSLMKVAAWKGYKTLMIINAYDYRAKNSKCGKTENGHHRLAWVYSSLDFLWAEIPLFAIETVCWSNWSDEQTYPEMKGRVCRLIVHTRLYIWSWSYTSTLFEVGDSCIVNLSNRYLSTSCCCVCSLASLKCVPCLYLQLARHPSHCVLLKARSDFS